jgi:chorismate dehydratase
MLRVGQIPYLNLEPFFFGLSRVAALRQAQGAPALELHPLPPRAMGVLADEGGLDAGAFSLMDSVRLGDRFEPLGDFCLACAGEVRSVLFFARRPIEKMAGATVAVTGETATSVVLLKLLLARRYGLKDVRYVELAADEVADGCLLIGDGALRRRHGIEGLPHRYDLAEEWAAWQGLPFIFARWMVRAAANEDEKAALREALGERLRANLASLDAIGRARRDLGMTVAEIKTYLEGFTFELGERERRGMETFVRLARSLTPGERPADAKGG